MADGTTRANEERLWQTLMDLAKIGATPGGGVGRIALTEDDRKARDQFVAWCKEAGCDIRVDRMGNIFARRHGLDGRSRERCEVETPVAAVRPDRGEAGDHGTVDRCREGAGQDGEGECDDRHTCECRATATTNLPPQDRRGKGPGGP